MKTITIQAEEVMADVRSAAWLEQELHEGLDRHRRHQMADICEEGNVETAWRVLATAVSEVRMALRKILREEHATPLHNELARPDEWRFGLLFRIPTATTGYLRDKIHEYLVAAVMEDRAGVIIPECRRIWKERAEEALRQLEWVATTARTPWGRVKRPIWPGG